MPQPSYPLFDFLAGLESVTLSPYPLVWEGRWRIDTDALAAAVTEKVRAILVVQPGNPTGSSLSHAELACLRSLGIPVIADEVFLDYPTAKDTTRVGSLAAERELPCFVLSGLSKVAALPQLKLGWIVAAGPDEARHTAGERLELIADTYLSVGTPVQRALPRLLAVGDTVRAQIMARLQTNRAHLEATLRETSGQLLPADGGWYATIRVPRVHSEEEWALLLLREEDLLVHPGYFFDFPEEAYLVVSLLLPSERFAVAAERLARHLV